MPDASTDRAIGRLEGKIDTLIKETEKATEARKVQYEKLDALGRKLESAERKVESIDKRLEAVEEPVAELSRWRERGIGALMFITFVSASLGATLAAFGKKIWSALFG